MGRKLVEIIEEQTGILYRNVRLVLEELTDDELSKRISDMPAWKHVYHMLHSLDQWVINPYRYEDPSFHEPQMNSLFHLGKRSLSKNELEQYFDSIESKLDQYLAGLSDEMLEEKPGDCRFTRLALILAQYRHTMFHLGVLHCKILMDTGKWPGYIGISPPVEATGRKG